MDTRHPRDVMTRRERMMGALHPLLALAAVAVIAFSGVGIWTMTRHHDDLADTSADNATQPVSEPLIQPAVARAPAVAPRAPAVAPRAPADADRGPVQAAAACTNCGRVESVTYTDQAGRGTGVGAVAGGLLGGVLGNQIGHGHGRTAATVVGAAAGAYGGNRVEENRNASRIWTVRVRLENGETRTFTQSSEPGWHEGDQVRVVDGHLESSQG